MADPDLKWMALRAVEKAHGLASCSLAGLQPKRRALLLDDFSGEVKMVYEALKALAKWYADQGQGKIEFEESE